MHDTHSLNQYLGPLSEDILRAMIDATEPGEGLSWSETVALVREANAAHDDRFWAEDPENLEAEVNAALEALVSRGYLYEATDGLRVTEHDVLD